MEIVTRYLADDGLPLRFTDEDVAALTTITIHTGVSIPHWQCEDNPGYKLQYIGLKGSVYVWGDVGSWSGAYGGWMSVHSLLDYAKRTSTKPV